jgi:hypothetical protein
VSAGVSTPSAAANAAIVATVSGAGTPSGERDHQRAIDELLPQLEHREARRQLGRRDRLQRIDVGIEAQDHLLRRLHHGALATAPSDRPTRRWSSWRAGRASRRRDRDVTSACDSLHCPPFPRESLS